MIVARCRIRFLSSVNCFNSIQWMKCLITPKQSKCIFQHSSLFIIVFVTSVELSLDSKIRWIPKLLFQNVDEMHKSTVNNKTHQIPHQTSRKKNSKMFRMKFDVCKNSFFLYRCYELNKWRTSSAACVSYA